MLGTLRKKRADGGFTLVELLITIVIIGILAAVVVLAIGGLTDSGEDSACGATADAAEAASVAYYSDQDPGSWPSDFTTDPNADLGDQSLRSYLQERDGTAIAAGTITGNGWLLTMGGGGAAQPTFDCTNT